MLTLLGAWAALAAVPFQASGHQGSGYAQVERALASWRAAHGASWQIAFEPQTLRARTLFGGRVEAGAEPRSDAEFARLARRALLETRALHGLELETLVDDEVAFLPLSAAGSVDKVAVQLRQERDGVAVLGGFANVLFDAHGRLLGVDSTALPGALDVGTTPALGAAEAARRASELFELDTRLDATTIRAPELAIAQVLAGKLREPRLVWCVTLLHAPPSGAATGFEYRLDARNGALVERLDAVHNDVSGTVSTLASPGLLPDMPSNPVTQQPLVRVSVQSAAGNALSDAAGNFTIAGASAPLNVTVAYEGPFCSVQDQAQADYSLTPALNAASGNALLLNPAAAANVTAEANAFVWVNKLRDYVRAVNPSDGRADFKAIANVNLNQTCNAYYDGASVNFFLAGGGCNNTSYSTVVAHEMGHWYNARYYSGNGADGFGEGAADAWSMYLTDDPDVGEWFGTGGWGIRSGTNTRAFCGDANPGCYGEVHADGEVLMGALWKVRAGLKASLGASAGALAADTLFNSWFNAFNDAQIRTVVETHWLMLDDDDGDISNGTPNYAAIDGGFRAQGFPGYDLAALGFANVTRHADTEDTNGPYVIEADITATQLGPVVSPQLHWRAGGGAWQVLSMQGIGGARYGASIPGQPCATDVDYYITALDGAGTAGSYPVDAPNGMLDFLVGWRYPACITDFESGVAGWTHGSFNDTPNHQDEWLLSSSIPTNGAAGKAGDPYMAASGTNLWGLDLGNGGSSGAYAANVHAWLRSPPVDCSGMSDVRLRFKRWLTVERGTNDQAEVRVNGVLVWQNPSNADLLDRSWVPVELDVSAIAANAASVVVEFSLRSDGALEFGGWNIDDFSLATLGLCGHSCPKPVTYCEAKPTSQLTIPAIGSRGIPTVVTDDFVVTLRSALPNKQGVCFWGGGPAQALFKGGYRCVLQPLVRMGATQSNAAGFMSVAVPVDASMAGATRFYQWWFRDPYDPYTIGLSDGLQVDFRL